ncbi:MAG: 2-phospho-L-lactate transferase CofD family protein, partial [Coriobacteriales bacterium]|nr:2-phospho-L-lactate transferase CofD family protein [Coriobacteriales bacterium]
HSQTALDAVCLKPRSPQAYQPALEAIMAADVIVLGPGSLFTSIIPNLLVPGVLEAIRQSRALTCFVCSLTDMQGETWGLDAAELVEMLLAHGMDGLLDVVIAQQDSEGQRPQGNVTAAFAAITEQFPPSGQAQSGKTSTHRVTMDEAMARRVLAHGIQVVLRDLTDPLHPSSHDVSALSDVLKGVISRCPSRLK